MPKLLIKAPPKPKGAAPKAPQLTLEQIRKTHEFGTLERAVGECQELVTIKDSARELTNLANRQKTQAGKALKQMVADETLGLGDEIQIGDMAFCFDYHTSESIDTRQLYELTVAGKVALDSFLKCIYVNKDMATKLIGDHVMRPITSSKIGNKADVRIRDLDTPVSSVQIVKKPPPPASRKKLLRETDEKPVVNVSNGGGRVLRRRINVRAS